VPVPWKSRSTVQVLTEVADDNGQPWHLNPRRVLEQIEKRLLALGFKPVVALELEFYLLDISRSSVQPQTGEMDLPEFSGPQTYNLDVLVDHQAFLDSVESACRAQGIPATSITSEYGNGQFEINLKHSDNCMVACDEALLLRRVVRQIAATHGAFASFMAKPLHEQSGNGMHVHVSLVEVETGNNAFAVSAQQPGELQQQAMAGVLELLPGAMALLLQNGNAYKRIVPDSFAPVYADWGLDHRGVAIRVPHDRDQNMRFEHRVAGADGNPYLVVATILAGIHHGLSKQLPLPKPTKNQSVSPDARRLPARWLQALDEFDQCADLKSYFGDEFSSLYLDLKRDEEQRFHALVDASDHNRYLRTL